HLNTKMTKRKKEGFGFGVKLPYHLQDYCVLDMLSEGVFGQVLHCLKPTSAETVAVKVLKKEGQYSLKRELAMLHRVQQLDPEKCHVVKFIDTFVWNDNTCMVFEMLDCSLIDFCKRRKKRPNLSEIRVIAQQLLMAFEALGELGIVHTDLKPDNVMLVNCKNQPLKVKLIDFGVAHLKSEMKLGSSHQNIYYQAPEVSLGLPLTEALDMWSLGVVLVVLYLCVVGGYYKDTLMAPIDTAGQLQGSNLDEAIRDRMGFLNLLRKLLHVDFSKRITPSEALQHEFITLEYFEENQDEYVKQARDLMGLVQRNTSRDPQNLTPEKVSQEVKEMPPTSRECSSLYPESTSVWRSRKMVRSSISHHQSPSKWGSPRRSRRRTNQRRSRRRRTTQRTAGQKSITGLRAFLLRILKTLRASQATCLPPDVSWRFWRWKIVPGKVSEEVGLRLGQ
uniref:Protein kinase domain-containing protein n=1 Tax=Periophthalmus magnuspinnatus TaxID=409849 RepID=A0A3B4AHH4_9GOBI